MAASTLTSKGQITLPQPVRQRLGLKTGDRIDFVFERGGRVVLQTHRTPFEKLRGIAKHARRRPATIREMDDAIAAAAKDKFLNERRRTGLPK